MQRWQRYAISHVRLTHIRIISIQRAGRALVGLAKLFGAQAPQTQCLMYRRPSSLAHAFLILCACSCALLKHGGAQRAIVSIHRTHVRSDFRKVTAVCLTSTSAPLSVGLKCDPAVAHGIFETRRFFKCRNADDVLFATSCTLMRMRWMCKARDGKKKVSTTKKKKYGWRAYTNLNLEM